MVPDVSGLPGNKRPVEQGVDSQVRLPPRDPRGEVVERTQGRHPEHRTVDARFQRLAITTLQYG